MLIGAGHHRRRADSAGGERQGRANEVCVCVCGAGRHKGRAKWDGWEESEGDGAPGLLGAGFAPRAVQGGAARRCPSLPKLRPARQPSTARGRRQEGQHWAGRAAFRACLPRAGAAASLQDWIYADEDGVVVSHEGELLL